MSRSDVYTRVTNRIIADLEKGVRSWMKPWSADNTQGRITLPLRHNGIPYRGINILMLWGAAVERGHCSPTWMSYRQAQELGGQVRKGEKGSLVVYANTLTKTESNEDGEEEERSIPYMKGYAVFNVDQIDGLPARYQAKPELITVATNQRIEQADRFFCGHGCHHPPRR